MTDKTKPEVMTAQRMARIRRKAEEVVSLEQAASPGVCTRAEELAADDVPDLLSALETADLALADARGMAVAAEHNSQTNLRLAYDRRRERDEAIARRDDALASLSEMTRRRNGLMAERDEAILAGASAVRKYAEAVARVAELETALADARGRWDVSIAALLMVGSELAGDPKINPDGREDPRWTPTLAYAARCRRERDLLAGRVQDAEFRVAELEQQLRESNSAAPEAKLQSGLRQVAREERDAARKERDAAQAQAASLSRCREWLVDIARALDGLGLDLADIPKLVRQRFAQAKGRVAELERDLSDSKVLTTEHYARAESAYSRGLEAGAADAAARVAELERELRQSEGMAEGAHARVAELEGALAWRNPWPLPDLLDRAAGALEHLVRNHDCDAHGWEELAGAAPLMRECAAKIRTALAAAPPEQAPSMETCARDVWRCSGCGEMLDNPPGTAWRWNGKAWEHRCPERDPQAGYEPARNFGPRLAPETAIAILGGGVTDAMALQDVADRAVAAAYVGHEPTCPASPEQAPADTTDTDPPPRVTLADFALLERLNTQTAEVMREDAALRRKFGLDQLPVSIGQAPDAMQHPGPRHCLDCRTDYDLMRQSPTCPHETLPASSTVTASEDLVSGEHRWLTPEEMKQRSPTFASKGPSGWTTCRWCGVVKRADETNIPCPGKSTAPVCALCGLSEADHLIRRLRHMFQAGAEHGGATAIEIGKPADSSGANRGNT